MYLCIVLAGLIHRPQYMCIAGHRTLRRGTAIYIAVLRRFMCIASAGNIHRTHMLRVLCVHICIVCVSYVLDVRVYAWYYGHMTWTPTGYAPIPSPVYCVWRCRSWPIRTKWASFSTAPVEKPVENSDDSGFGGLGVFHSTVILFHNAVENSEVGYWFNQLGKCHAVEKEFSTALMWQ